MNKLLGNPRQSNIGVIFSLMTLLLAFMQPGPVHGAATDSIARADVIKRCVAGGLGRFDRLKGSKNEYLYRRVIGPNQRISKPFSDDIPASVFKNPAARRTIRNFNWGEGCFGQEVIYSVGNSPLDRFRSKRRSFSDLRIILPRDESGKSAGPPTHRVARHADGRLIVSPIGAPLPNSWTDTGLTGDSQQVLRYAAGFQPDLNGGLDGPGQRTGLARALLSEPRVLLLDEPLSGLDPIGRIELAAMDQARSRPANSKQELTDALKQLEQMSEGLLTGDQLKDLTKGLEQLRGAAGAGQPNQGGGNDRTLPPLSGNPIGNGSDNSSTEPRGNDEADATNDGGGSTSQPVSIEWPCPPLVNTGQSANRAPVTTGPCGAGGCANEATPDDAVVQSTLPTPAIASSTQRPARQTQSVQVASGSNGTPVLTVKPLKDHLFFDDNGKFKLTIRHAGHDQPTKDSSGSDSPGSRCVLSGHVPWQSVMVEVTVYQKGSFLSGIRSRTFFLPPFEQKEFDVAAAPLLADIKYIGDDRMYGATIEIKAWRADDPGKSLVFDDSFSVYRFLDAADDNHRDGVVMMHPTLQDGPDKVIRKRKIDVVRVHDKARLAFRVSDAPNFRNETPGGDATIVFDPELSSSEKTLTGQLELLNANKGNRLVGKLLIGGKGTIRNKVFLNKDKLLQTYATLSNVSAIPKYHVNTALFTNSERAHIANSSLRTAIVNDIFARINMLLGSELTPGIELVDQLSKPAETVAFDWLIRMNGPKPGVPITNGLTRWSERLVEHPKYTHYQAGAMGKTDPETDNIDATLELIGRSNQYNTSEALFRLANTLNPSMVAQIRMWPDSLFEESASGQPLELSRAQAVNATAKTAVHEYGHSLGLPHMAQMRPSTKGDFHIKEISLTGGNPNSPVRLGFMGHETIQMPRDASPAERQKALRDLPSVAGDNITVGGVKNRPASVFRISFFNAFDGHNVKDLTVFDVSGAGIGIANKTFQAAHPQTAVPGVNTKYVEMQKKKGDPWKIVPAPTERGEDYGRMLIWGPNLDFGDTDIMAGGFNDVNGVLRFRRGMSLTGAQIALHLDYTRADAFGYLQTLQSYHALALSGRKIPNDWDSYDEQDDLGLATRKGKHLQVLVNSQAMPRRLVYRALINDDGFINPAETIIRIRNVGDKPVNVHSIRMANAPDFAGATDKQLPAVVAPGASLALTVRYAPTFTSATTRGRLTIQSDSAMPELAYTLAGDVFGLQPNLRATMRNNNLGAIPVGKAIRRSVTLTNHGVVPVVIRQVQQSRDFTALLKPLPSGRKPLVINPGASVAFPVEFRPRRVGISSGTIHLVGDNPLQSAMTFHLVGTGLGTSTPPNTYRVARTALIAGKTVHRQQVNRGTINLPIQNGSARLLAVHERTGLVASDRLIIRNGRLALTPPIYEPSIAPDRDGNGKPDDIDFILRAPAR